MNGVVLKAENEKTRSMFGRSYVHRIQFQTFGVYEEKPDPKLRRVVTGSLDGQRDPFVSRQTSRNLKWPAVL